ncbi:MAG: hypothetical protein QOF77_2154 [Solirubrobacteraceae bacterium]|nr:hypothetical protein [Solirubrobacteraceae bacterium]
MRPEQICPTPVAPTPPPTPEVGPLPGTSGLGRTIADVLARVNELERAEAAREQAAHESRVGLAGLGVRLWRAQLLTRELEALPRRGGNPARRPAALADIRETVAAASAELAARSVEPDRAEPATGLAAAAEAGVLGEMATIVERLRAEIEDVRRSSVPVPVHAATVEEARALRELLENLGREHAVAVRALEAHTAPERRPAQTRLPVAPPAAPSSSPAPTDHLHGPSGAAAAEAGQAARPRRGLRLDWPQARTESWLARALHELAETDASAATDLAVALLPAMAPRVKGRLVFSITVPELACFRVTIDQGATTVEEFGAPVPGLGEFSIEASLAAFLDFACGAGRRRGAGMIVGGNRRRFHRLLRGARALTLVDAARLAIPLDADLALLAVAASIRAEWTLGYGFTVGFDVLGPHGGSWVVTVADGAPVRVSADPGARATCRLTLKEEVFLRFLCNRTLPADGVPVVEGEKHVAVMLMRWMTRAQDQRHMVGPGRTEFARPSAAA